MKSGNLSVDHFPRISSLIIPSANIASGTRRGINKRKALLSNRAPATFRASVSTFRITYRKWAFSRISRPVKKIRLRLVRAQIREQPTGYTGTGRHRSRSRVLSIRMKLRVPRRELAARRWEESVPDGGVHAGSMRRDREKEIYYPSRR